MTTPPPPAPTVSVAAVRITVGKSAQIDEQGTVTLTAQAQTTAGVVVSATPLTWTTVDPGTAAVSTAGVVTAVAPGVARIVVSAAVTTATPDTALVTVTAIPVASVALTDSLVPAALAVGDTATVSAQLMAASGAPLAATNGRTLTWSTADPSVAAVSSTGLVTGRAAGTTVVRATSGGPGGPEQAVTTVRVAASPFRIALSFDASVSADLAAAARLAARRWERVMVGGSTAPLDTRLAGCTAAASLAAGQQGIRVRVASSSAGANSAVTTGDCLRTDYQFLSATVTVDPTLAARVTTSAGLDPTVVAILAHEIGHGLGMGAWRYQNPRAMLDSAATVFTGPQAAAAWQALGGSGNAPLQPTSPGHWSRTGGLCTELMEPVVTFRSRLSAVTLAALADMGWTVVLARADAYTKTSC